MRGLRLGRGRGEVVGESGRDGEEGRRVETAVQVAMVVVVIVVLVVIVGVVVVVRRRVVVVVRQEMGVGKIR